MPIGTLTWTTIFERCLIEFGSQLRPPEPQKTMIFRLFFHTFCKIGLSKLRPILDPIWVPTCLHFLPQIHQNLIFNGIKKLCDLGIDFYAFLGPTWSHLGLQLGPILVPRSPPNRLPRRIWEPEPAQTPKMTPKWSPRPSKMRPQTPHFGSLLMLILDTC